MIKRNLDTWDPVIYLAKESVWNRFFRILQGAIFMLGRKNKNFTSQRKPPLLIISLIFRWSRMKLCKILTLIIMKIALYAAKLLYLLIIFHYSKIILSTAIMRKTYLEIKMINTKAISIEVINLAIISQILTLKSLIHWEILMPLIKHTILQIIKC